MQVSTPTNLVTELDALQLNQVEVANQQIDQPAALLPGLYLIPVPIGPDNQSAQLPPSIAATISQIQLFFVENVRTARRFISSLQLGINIESLTFFQVDKDTTAEEILQYGKMLKKAKVAGLMSEAGCPAVADPGSMLVAQVHRMRLQVYPMVGPSSIILALMASGLNGQSFAFNGYLPIKREDRQKAIQNFELESKRLQKTQIFIETPFRNQAMLTALLTSLQPNTLVSVAFNLTQPSSFCKTLKVSEWVSNALNLEDKQPAIFMFLGAY